MQEVTKRPLTDGNIEISLVVPPHQADDIAEAVAGLLALAEQLSEGIVILPPAKIGKALRGFRRRAELTQDELAAQLAARIASPQIVYGQRTISQMENGNRPISKEEAGAFAAIFKTDPRCFLE